MRITFLGGTIFIGAAAARRAVERGHVVSVLHRGVHPNPEPRAVDVLVDREDPVALDRALATTRPDVVVDTRAMDRVTAVKSASVLVGRIVPAVILSSQDVYEAFGRVLGHPGDPPRGPIDEDAPLTVPYPYRGRPGHDDHDDYDKKDVEQVFQSAYDHGDLSALTILRLPATYGPGDPVPRFGPIVDALDAGDGTLPCVDGACWRWTHAHVEDVAMAIVLAAEQADGARTFNVGEPETPTMAEWAERIGAAMGKTVQWREVEELPQELSHLGRIENDVVADTRRIRAALGYREITTPEQRVRDVIAQARAVRAERSSSAVPND